MRWLIAGAGQISRRFVPDIRQAGGDVAAIWARRAEAAGAFAMEFDVPRHSDKLSHLLARDDIDAVYVATPPAVHTDVALQALDAGKHVLVEKPLATSAREAEIILDRASTRGLFAMEAMWMKFNPLHRELKRLICGGTIGEPRSVMGGFGMPFPAGGSRWDAKAGGSTILDQGIYPVTLANWVLGDALEVFATGEVDADVDVRASITTVHGLKQIAHSACSMVEFVSPTATVNGTAGWIEIPGLFWAGERASVHAGSAESLFRSPKEIVRHSEGFGYVPMIREVQSAIGAGLHEHPWHTGKSALAVLHALDDARRQIHGKSISDLPT